MRGSTCNGAEHSVPGARAQDWSHLGRLAQHYDQQPVPGCAPRLRADTINPKP